MKKAPAVFIGCIIILVLMPTIATVIIDVIKILWASLPWFVQFGLIAIPALLLVWLIRAALGIQPRSRRR